MTGGATFARFLPRRAAFFLPERFFLPARFFPPFLAARFFPAFLPARFLAVLFPVFLVFFFAAMSMPPANLGSAMKFRTNPRYVARRILPPIATCQRKKCNGLPSKGRSLRFKTTQVLRARQLSSAAAQADWQDCC